MSYGQLMIELFELVDERGGEAKCRFEPDMIDIHWSRPKEREVKEKSMLKSEAGGRGSRGCRCL